VKIYQFWNLHALLGGEIEKLLNHPLLEVMEVKRRVENPLGYEWSKLNVSEISPTVGFVETVIGNNNLIVHQLLEQTGDAFSGARDAFSPRKQPGDCEFSQSQRRGIEGGGESSRRWTRQRERRGAAEISPHDFRCGRVFAAGVESQKGITLE